MTLVTGLVILNKKRSLNKSYVRILMLMNEGSSSSSSSPLPYEIIKEKEGEKRKKNIQQNQQAISI
jgi:hypothetical protein